MEKLGLPLKDLDVQFVCDNKLLMIIVGIQGANPNSMYSCPYGFCYRARRNEAGEWERTGDPGRWIMGEARTFASCKAKHDEWIAAGGNRNDLKNFMSQEYVPLRMFEEKHDDTPFSSLMPPCPLHNFMGKLKILI